jgi:hypothetical protein
MQTGHSSNPISPWFSISSSSLIRLQLQRVKPKMHAFEQNMHDSERSVTKAENSRIGCWPADMKKQKCDVTESTRRIYRTEKATTAAECMKIIITLNNSKIM